LNDYPHFTNKLTHSTVRTYRIIASVSLLILRVLSHGRNISFYFADASARTSSDTASTWCVCGLKRFSEPFEDYLHFTNKLTHSTWCVCGTQKVQWTFWGL